MVHYLTNIYNIYKLSRPVFIKPARVSGLSFCLLTEIWSNKQKVHDSNMFLTQCWRLDTTSRPFHNFNEIAI